MPRSVPVTRIALRFIRATLLANDYLLVRAITDQVKQN